MVAQSKCFKIWDVKCGRNPVCGTDWYTYPSFCHFDHCKSNVNVRFLHKGACKCSSVAPSMVKPLCGSNGRTYRNKWVLRNDNCKERLVGRRRVDVTVAHQGPCKEEVTECCSNICGAGRKFKGLIVLSKNFRPSQSA